MRTHSDWLSYAKSIPNPAGKSAAEPENELVGQGGVTIALLL